MVSAIVTDATFDEFITKLNQANSVVVDVETDGLSAWKDNQLCGVGIAFDATDGYYLPFRHPDNNIDLRSLPRLWEALLCVNNLVGYNIKFDMAFLHRDGYVSRPDQSITDVIVAARMCSPEKYPKLSLSGQLEEYFGYEARAYDDEFKEYLRKNKWAKTFHLAPAEKVGIYCIGDVCNTWRLKDRLEEIIDQTNQRIVWEQEQEVTRALWCMERRGLGYDEVYGSESIPKLEARINNLKSEIFAQVGYEFNLNSGPQLSKAMNSIGLHSTARSDKTGKELWSVAVLMGIEHPVAGKILELRSLEKVLGTYFKPIMEWPNNMVHCSFKNWGTVTGRMSCSDPNLQNLAKNVQNLMGNSTDEETQKAMQAFLGVSGKTTGERVGGVTLGGLGAVSSNYEESDHIISVRRMFIGRPGYQLYMLDYSQMEMRVFADYVRDAGLNELLESATFDFHTHVAKTVWQVDESSSLWKFYRTLAKAINFGLIYGIGVNKLAQQLQTTPAEAKSYKKQYFARFPKAEKFIQQVLETIERRGYIFNRFKRRYWLDPSRSYVGVNYLVQGTSADIVKNRMVACQKYIEEHSLKSHMLAQVHDELVFEVHDSEVSWFPWKMQEIMQERMIDTFLPVEVAKGMNSWAQKVKWDDVKQDWKVDS